MFLAVIKDRHIDDEYSLFYDKEKAINHVFSYFNKLISFERFAEITNEMGDDYVYYIRHDYEEDNGFVIEIEPE